jgi:hypothetical protein
MYRAGRSYIVIVEMVRFGNFRILKVKCKAAVHLSLLPLQRPMQRCVMGRRWPNLTVNRTRRFML